MKRAAEMRIGSIRGRISLPRRWRGASVGLALAGAVLLLILASLCLGTIALEPARVVAALAGQGDGASRLIVAQWRLPRIVTAVTVGGALGMSGAIFQSLLRNPLGSPDVVGFATGAYTGALMATILFGAGPSMVAPGAIAGGIATAALVHALAWRDGLPTARVVLVGVAVSAMLSACNHWLMLSGSLDAAIGAAIWGAGSLAGIGWSTAMPGAVMCLAGMAACLALTPQLRLLEMGNDFAITLGLDAGRSRLVQVGLGTVLIAVATAQTGPIAFVALAAPQLARRLARTGMAAPLLSALVGALMLVSADLIAQHAFSPLSLPTGLVTLCVGGIYLVWLLTRQQRIRTR